MVHIQKELAESELFYAFAVTIQNGYHLLSHDSQASLGISTTELRSEHLLVYISSVHIVHGFCTDIQRIQGTSLHPGILRCLKNVVLNGSRILNMC